MCEAPCTYYLFNFGLGTFPFPMAFGTVFGNTDVALTKDYQLFWSDGSGNYDTLRVTLSRALTVFTVTFDLISGDRFTPAQIWSSDTAGLGPMGALWMGLQVQGQVSASWDGTGAPTTPFVSMSNPSASGNAASGDPATGGHTAWADVGFPVVTHWTRVVYFVPSLEQLTECPCDHAMVKRRQMWKVYNR